MLLLCDGVAAVDVAAVDVAAACCCLLMLAAVDVAADVAAV
jgi:hypothetical protein